jgi:2,3-bisphosphoglycerate-independent phosphoglycerate mutase
MPARIAKRPFVLIIRDGWGNNPHPEMDAYNAIKQAKHPADDRLMAEYPHVLIKTSGEDVGLPAGVMGNSEVGHQNIGAGGIVDQETMRITRTIRDGSFFTNKTLKEAFAFAKANKGKVHILGLCSNGQVHSDQEHAYAILVMAKREGMASDKVLVHAILDGRDTPPQSGAGFIAKLDAKCKEIGVGRVATVIGRFYIMDRDNMWDRVQRGYELLTENKGDHFATAREAIEKYYANPTNTSQKGDEFVTPSVIGPGGKVEDGDAFIFFNYRGDRPREITKAFVYDDAKFAAEKNGGFKRNVHPTKIYFATMSAYESGLPVHVIFVKPERMKNLFGEYLGTLGLKQFRSAETQKYAHVTFFFNDYRDPPFPLEDRKLVDSPRVATFDKKPEMAAPEVCAEVLKELDKGAHDVYIINFANGDMVGHTGDLQAAIKAVEAVDQCVGKIADKTLALGGALIITADHGNCEQMWDPINNCPHTAHTTFDVPLILVDDRFKAPSAVKLRTGGNLADIVPTALQIMGLPQPAEMTGKSLLP